MATTPEDAVLRELLDSARPLQAELDSLSPTEESGTKRRFALQHELAGIRAAYNERIDRIRDVGGLRLDVLAISLLISTLAPLVQLSLTSAPWLPAERITLSSKETVVGYVVSTKDDWATILVDKPRLVKNVKSDDILVREICVTTEDSNTRTTIWRLPVGDGENKYPKC